MIQESSCSSAAVAAGAFEGDVSAVEAAAMLKDALRNVRRLGRQSEGSNFVNLVCEVGNAAGRIISRGVSSFKVPQRRRAGVRCCYFFTSAGWNSVRMRVVSAMEP